MPNKQLWIKIWIQIKNSLKFAAVFLIDKNPITKARLKAFCAYVRRSWKSIAVILPLVLLLYYTIGGYVTNTIDKNISFESKVYDRGLNVVGVGADLIKREVDDNMWTPNLPFIFPGYVLDNMPAFQTGVIQSVASSANIMSKIFDNEELKKANELLKYPPNIWILSKSDDLALAPSSGAQYRKARNALLKFNKEFEADTEKREAFLQAFLRGVEKDLNKISEELETQVREFSSKWFDYDADNVFYKSQGRIYGYYVLLKALSTDFKSVIVEAKQYEKLTSVLKSLEEGVVLNPSIVRNGEIDSVMAANHLVTLNYHVAKAKYNLVKIRNTLARENK